MRNQQRTVVIPAQPKPACYYFDQDENGLTLRTNFWMFARVMVSIGFLSFTLLISGACYKKLLKLWDSPGVWDYVLFALAFIFGLYLLGVTAKMLFERIHIVLNSNGMQYRYRILFYSFQRHIPLQNIREFKRFTKHYNQKHTGYFVQTVTDEDELLIFCDNGVNQDWLEAEMNYMLIYLREKDKGVVIPQFRQTCIINDVKYRFRSENKGDQ